MTEKYKEREETLSTNQTSREKHLSLQRLGGIQKASTFCRCIYSCFRSSSFMQTGFQCRCCAPSTRDQSRINPCQQWRLHTKTTNLPAPETLYSISNTSSMRQSVFQNLPLHDNEQISWLKRHSEPRHLRVADRPGAPPVRPHPKCHTERYAVEYKIQAWPATKKKRYIL